MKARVVQTKIWEDEWFCNLTRNARILFFYLITNQRIGLTGCYEISERTIIFDTQFTALQYKHAKEELVSRVVFSDGWVFVKNSAKYNNYVHNSKQAAAYIKEYEKIPPFFKKSVPALDAIYHTSTIHVSDMYDTSRNKKPEIRNKKPEIRKENQLVNSKTVDDPEEQVRAYLESRGIEMEVRK
jgi:hypothetical protein